MAFFIKYDDRASRTTQEIKFGIRSSAIEKARELIAAGHANVRIVNSRGKLTDTFAEEYSARQESPDPAAEQAPYGCPEAAQTDRNAVSGVLLAIGLLTIAFGIVAGIAAALRVPGGFHWLAAIAYWSGGIVTGCLFIGFAEVVDLLDQINKKMPRKP